MNPIIRDLLSAKQIRKIIPKFILDISISKEKTIMAGKGNARSGSSQAKDMGSKGGKSGGPARARKLTTQQRSDIARKGAVAKNAKKK